MSQGKQTGTAASAEMLAASEYREHVTITLTNTTGVALGVGEAAVADEGLQLLEPGDTIGLRGSDARGQINIIGNGGTLTHFTGEEVLVTRAALTT